MTWDEFEASYRLLQEITTLGGATTHHALSSEGVVVMVHVVRSSEPTDLLDRAQATGGARIIERVRVEDADVLVTRFIMEFESLEAWVADQQRSLSGGAPPAPTATPPADLPAPPSEPEATDEPGEFTRMFRAPAADQIREGGDEPAARDEAGAEATAPEPEPPAHDAARTTRDAGAHEPGEFTRAFRAPKGDQPPPSDAERHTGSPTPPSPPAEAPPPGGSSASEPGEFTRMFRAPEAPPTGGGDQAEHPPKRPAPSRDAPRRMPAPPPTAASSPPEPRWSFDEPAPASGGADIQDGYADRLRTPGPARPAPTPPPPPEADAGPGAYTRMISVQKTPTSAPPDHPAPRSDDPADASGTPDKSGTASAPDTAAGSDESAAQASAPDADPPSIVPFVVAIALIVVTAVALVLAVALFA